MPRTGHRRSLSIAVALLAMLAAPAAAQAATYTVKGGDGPCGGADTACGGMADAATAAAPGDIFKVSPGIYGSANFTVGGVTVTGDPLFTVNGTLTFSSNAGAVSKLQKAAINENVGAGTGVVVSGSSGLEISDSVILSNNGDAVTFSAGAANKIMRSVIGTGGQSTAAVRVTSPDTADSKKLVMESTLVTGGAAGLSVNTGLGNGLIATAGNVEVVLRHVTSAGSTNGLVLDASKANPLVGGPVGNITASVTDSIIQGGTLKSNYGGVILVAPANSVMDTYTRTLQSPFSADAVFAKPASRNFRLRPGSPAINAGGITAGESATDLDGQDRSAAPTDQGADEFVDEPPKAVIAIKTSPQRSGQAVTFDGSGSTDRETGIGGGIARYHWEFGDGTASDTTTSSTTHIYAKEGKGTASLTVVDTAGQSSAPATAAVDVVDGSVPAVVITKPKANQKIKLTKTTTKTVTVMEDGKAVKVKKKTTKRTKIGFAGTAKDKSGIKSVVLTVEKLSTTTTTPRAATTTTKRCKWLDPKKGVVLKSCAKPILIVAKFAAGTWTYNVKSTIKLGAGLYRVSAYALDNAGSFGNSAPSKDAVHRFTLVKK